MKKPTVIIDVDDTIADTQVHILAWINQRSSRQYLWHELDRTFREGRQPEYETHMQAYLATPEHAREIEPYEDALTGIKLLHKAGLELHVVTARDASFTSITLEWLTNHGFVDFVDRIHYRPKDQHGHIFKRNVANQIQPLAAFDDTYDVGLELANAGVYTYLIDKPWNTNTLLPAAMERVPSFASGVQRFLQRKIS